MAIKLRNALDVIEGFFLPYILIKLGNRKMKKGLSPLSHFLF